jgi:hypothetical protein
MCRIKCIYHKDSEKKIFFLIIYIDDILRASSDLSLFYKVKQFLSTQFDMKNMSKVSNGISIEIKGDRPEGH